MKVIGKFRKAGCLTVDSDLIWDSSRFEQGPEDIVVCPTNDLGIAGLYEEYNGYMAKVHYVYPVPQEYEDRIYAWNIRTGEVLCYGLECDAYPMSPHQRGTRVFYVEAISISKEET